MNTPNPTGQPIVQHSGYDEHEEAFFVAGEIKQLLAQEVSPKDIAVFYRTNAQSRAIEEALCEYAIPYQIFGGLRFYDRKEIKDLLAYFRLLINPDDNEAFLRVINVPTRGIGAKSVAALATFAHTHKLSLFAALQKALDEKVQFLTAANRKNFSKFRDIFEALQVDLGNCRKLLEKKSGDTGFDFEAQSRAIADLLKAIADKTEYLKRLKQQETLEAEARIENIYELFRVALDFVTRNSEQEAALTLNDFLDRASLSSDLDKEENVVDRQQGSISLLTLHLAKGLEFEIVFMIGLEEGLLPHSRSLSDRDALEEERRLCYVGITRAKKQLYLTHATTRQTFGANSYFSGFPSRFLDDLPREVVVAIS